VLRSNNHLILQKSKAKLSLV